MARSNISRINQLVIYINKVITHQQGYQQVYHTSTRLLHNLHGYHTSTRLSQINKVITRLSHINKVITHQQCYHTSTRLSHTSTRLSPTSTRLSHINNFITHQQGYHTSTRLHINVHGYHTSTRFSLKYSKSKWNTKMAQTIRSWCFKTIHAITPIHPTPYASLSIV